MDTATPTTPGPAFGSVLEALAVVSGVTLPDLGTSSGRPTDGVSGESLTDTQILRAFVAQMARVPRSGSSAITASEASGAAHRMGPDKVLKLAAHLPASTRRSMIAAAAAFSWLPMTIDTFVALSPGMDRWTVLASAVAGGPLDASVTPSTLTTWIANRQPDGLSRAARVWSMDCFPEGVIDHKVIVELGLDNADQLWGASPRLSRQSVEWLANRDPRLVGFCANYMSYWPYSEDLVTLYDTVAEIQDPAERGRLRRPVIEMMTKVANPTKTLALRCKDYLIEHHVSVSGALGDLVLNTIQLNDAELDSVMTSPTAFVRWLDDGYNWNEPDHDTAVHLAAAFAGTFGVSCLVEHAEAKRVDHGGISHPERYDWFTNLLREDPRVPGALRQVLSNGLEGLDTTTLRGVYVKAAAASFAEASPKVQARLWRALASTPSIFDEAELSLDDATARFIQREAEAAARVAAKAPKAGK